MAEMSASKNSHSLFPDGNAEWQQQGPPGGVGRGSVERRWNGGGAARGWPLGVECRAVCLPGRVFRRLETGNERKMPERGPMEREPAGACK